MSAAGSVAASPNGTETPSRVALGVGEIRDASPDRGSFPHHFRENRSTRKGVAAFPIWLVAAKPAKSRCKCSIRSI